MKKGDIVELKITSYAFEGKGIAKIPSSEGGEFVVFVNGAYPGDTVKAMVRKKKKSFAEATVVEILNSSDLRTEPKCKYFGTCGGCKQQDMIYEKQLEFKKAQVVESFERIGGLKDFEVEPIAGSEKTFYYRNKMEYSFSNKRWLTKEELQTEGEIKQRNFALGLHIPRIFDKVLDINQCFLQSETSNDILNRTREFFLSKGISIYNTRTHTGYLRHLVIKTGHHTGDVMVNLVTSEWNEDLMKEYAGYLLENIEGIKSIINNINYKKGSTALGDEEH
ncbi:MAG: class I SAM-dependent RNA methyltransferase, partial [Bacteroidetes bacterium]